MFHSTALYRPATGADTIHVMIEHVSELIADMERTGKRKAYYAGRSRTRQEWIAFLDYQRKMLEV